MVRMVCMVRSALQDNDVTPCDAMVAVTQCTSTGAPAGRYVSTSDSQPQAAPVSVESMDCA